MLSWFLLTVSYLIHYFDLKSPNFEFLSHYFDFFMRVGVCVGLGWGGGSLLTLDRYFYFSSGRNGLPYFSLLLHNYHFDSFTTPVNFNIQIHLKTQWNRNWSVFGVGGGAGFEFIWTWLRTTVIWSWDEITDSLCL